MSNQPMLAPWLRRFLTEHIITERNLSVNTQKSYRDCFVLLLPFVSAAAKKPIERLSVQDVAASRVSDFLNHLETDRGCSIQTRNQRLTAIRALARYIGGREPSCIEWTAAIRSIAVKKSTSQPFQWLSKNEMEALLNAPDQRRLQGMIEHALLLFLYNTGARVSEAINVRVCDVQIDLKSDCHPIVILHGKGNKIRHCPLWSRTEKALVRLTEGKSESACVFTSQRKAGYSRHAVYRLVERCAMRVPSLANRKVTPHSIRHSCACLMLNAGVDINTIRAWLGHVSIDTTNIYAEIDLELKTQAMHLCQVAKPESSKSWKHKTELMAYLESI